MAYTGFAQGRSFDELHDGGAYIVDIDVETKRATLERITLSSMSYEIERVDITSLSNDDDVARRIGEAIDEKGYADKTALRIVLVGAVPSDYLLNERAISDALSSKPLALLQIRNETVANFDLSELESDITVRGEVYRKLLPLLNSEDERERKKASLALKFALSALDKREFGIDLIATSPSVIYEVVLTDQSIVMVDSPAKMPERQRISSISEPYIKTNIFVPSDYIGPIMELCQNKRGNYVSMEYIDSTRVNIHYEIPLSEIVYDFFDKLKSYTKGYASFDYEVIGYKQSNLVKMDILLNGEIVDALSLIVHKDFAYNRGKAIVENLRKLIPRQQFEIPIQAVIGTKAIARSDIKAVRKNVLAKCYGGDVSRKRKLLEKQKEGKKRMKMVGSVEVPQEAFLAVLSMDEG